jgi:hypothetical protein
MPYIKDENNRRKELRDGAVAKTAGELNYQIFTYFKYDTLGDVEKTIYNYIWNFLGDSPNYQKYNDMAGVMILCTKELKRRLNLETSTLLKMVDNFDSLIASYEDSKIILNGDV